MQIAKLLFAFNCFVDFVIVARALHSTLMY